MRKGFFSIMLTTALLSVGVSLQAAQVVDFEGLTRGTSVEGPGTVHPNLEIQPYDPAHAGTLLVVETGYMNTVNGNPCWAYRAPNDVSFSVNYTLNNCLEDGSGERVELVQDSDFYPKTAKGFTDAYARCNQLRQELVFLLDEPVSEFSIRMLDFADFNCDLQKVQRMEMHAYNGAGDPVDDYAVESVCPCGQANPGNTWVCGDACGAAADGSEPGYHTLKVVGSGIVRVEIVVPDEAYVEGLDWIPNGYDPNLAFDTIAFTLEELEVPVDIKPTSCPNGFNIGKGGVTPVAILGTVEFDVTQIDPASVRLEGVAPLRWALEDVATPYEPYTGKTDIMDCTTAGPDGYLDLTLKFSTPELMAAVGTPLPDPPVLHLTGNLKPEYGGTPFAGEDVVKFVGKASKDKGSKGKGK